jgi:hypothetical protein
VPRRAQPGHRVAIEAALTPVLLEAVEELRELLNIRDWQQSPLSAPFTQAAVVLAAAERVAAGECSESDALDAAAIALGVSTDTVRSRARRWPRDSRSLCTGRVEVTAGSFDGDREQPLSEVA